MKKNGLVNHVQLQSDIVDQELAEKSNLTNSTEQSQDNLLAKPDGIGNIAQLLTTEGILQGKKTSNGLQLKRNSVDSDFRDLENELEKQNNEQIPQRMGQIDIRTFSKQAARTPSNYDYNGLTPQQSVAGTFYKRMPRSIFDQKMNQQTYQKRNSNRSPTDALNQIKKL